VLLLGVDVVAATVETVPRLVDVAVVVLGVELLFVVVVVELGVEVGVVAVLVGQASVLVFTAADVADRP
jgi:hypothetical protein